MEMASGKKNQQLEEIHKCPICLELAKNPYILPCKHLFCKECLDELMEFSRNECAKVKCSLCNEIALSQTIDFLNSSTQKNLEKKNICCCMEECEETKDIFYYVEEQCYICYKCKQKTETPFGRFYNIKFSDKRKIVSAFCKVHDSFHDEYCLTCKSLCCKYCQFVVHGDHITKSLTSYSNEIDIQLRDWEITSKKLQENTETDMSEMEEKLENIDEEKMKWRNIINEMKTKYLFQCVYVLNLLSEEMNNNLDNLFTVFETQVKKSDTTDRQNVKELEKIKSIWEKSNSENMMEKLFNWEKIEKSIVVMTEKIKDQKNYTHPKLTLTQRDDNLHKNDCSLFGVLRTKMDSILFQNGLATNSEVTLLKKEGHKFKWKPNDDFDLCMNDPIEMQKYLINNVQNILGYQKHSDGVAAHSGAIRKRIQDDAVTHNEGISKISPENKSTTFLNANGVTSQFNADDNDSIVPSVASNLPLQKAKKKKRNRKRRKKKNANEDTSTSNSPSNKEKKKVKKKETRQKKKDGVETVNHQIPKESIAVKNNICKRTPVPAINATSQCHEHFSDCKISKEIQDSVTCSDVKYVNFEVSQVHSHNNIKAEIPKVSSISKESAGNSNVSSEEVKKKKRNKRKRKKKSTNQANTFVESYENCFRSSNKTMTGQYEESGRRTRRQKRSSVQDMDKNDKAQQGAKANVASKVEEVNQSNHVKKGIYYRNVAEAKSMTKM